MMTPLENYLSELRGSLRTPPEETSRILAEAEDHLRESVAFGLAAGLTETEAAEAAISSFGSVTAVARAHETSGDRAAAAAVGLSMAIWRLAGLVLVTIFAVLMVVLVVAIAAGHAHGATPPDSDDGAKPAILFALLSGPAGLALLGCWFLTRRFLQRHRLPRLTLSRNYAPLAETLIFAAAAAALTVLGNGARSVHHPLRLTAIAVCLAAAAACAIRCRRLLPRHRRDR